MEIKESANRDYEVLSKVEDIAFYYDIFDKPENICFVHILNPRLEGSAYYFDKKINVGINQPIGFNTGRYFWYDNEKYVEILLLLSGELRDKYNHPTDTMHKRLPKHIKYWFENKNWENTYLSFSVPTTCYVKEKDIAFIDPITSATIHYLEEGVTISKGVVRNEEKVNYSEAGRISEAVENLVYMQEYTHARTKCSYATAYILQNGILNDTGIKFYKRLYNIGLLTGKTTVINKKQYIEVIIPEINQKYWYKKVAVNIIDGIQYTAPSDNNKSSSLLLLGLAALLLGD